MIESRNEQDVDAGGAHQLDLLLGRIDETRCAAGRKKLDRVRQERQSYRLRAEFAGSSHDSFEDLPVSEMQAIKVADADNGGTRDIRILK